MKHIKVIAIVALLVAGASSTYAQTKDVEVKVLPTVDKGFIQVLFDTDHSYDVQVKFYNMQGLYTVDAVSKDSYQKGFLKKYDIRNVRPGENFWIEVTTKEVVATYKMIELKDHTAYEPKLEYTELNNAAIVASKD